MGLLNDLLYTNKTGRLAIKALDIHAQKSLITSSNIANVETPGYKARSVKPFEQELAEAFRPKVGMTKTNDKHMSGTKNLQSYQPQVEISRAPGRLDGNNVNLDKEMAEMGETSLMYQTIITANQKRGQIISSSIESAR